jgi:ribonuclease HI
MKYYAVKKGRKTGIFTSWSACEAQVKGYKGASYKSFATKAEAEAFLANTPKKVDPNGLVAYVDGSFHSVDHIYGYGVVLIEKGEVIKTFTGSGSDPDYVSMRNVAGEIFGSEAAIEYAIAHNYKAISVYYDYMGIEKWALGEWKANKKGTQAYVAKFQDYQKAIDVTFVKVSAHTGVTYNEMADQLAKQAVGIL